MKKFTLSFLFVLTIVITNAQDIHFSQYYYSPLNLNPALTGAIDGRYRVGIIYKNQWGSITSPFVYSTPSVSGELKLFGNGYNANYLGVGVLVLDDRSGDGNLQNFTAMLSLAYHQALDREGNTHISVGLQGGMVEKSIDFASLKFYDQFNGLEFSNPTAENFAYYAFGYADFAAGAAFSSVLSDQSRIQLGASIGHLTQPKESFYSLPTENVINMRYIAHASATFGIANKMFLFPFAHYQLQNNDNEVVAGANLGFNFSRDNYNVGTIFYGGVFYRLNYDIIPTLGFMMHGLQFGLSYDVNTSTDLHPATNGGGGFELALMYTGNIEAQHRVKRQYCPSF